MDSSPSQNSFADKKGCLRYLGLFVLLGILISLGVFIAGYYLIRAKGPDLLASWIEQRSEELLVHPSITDPEREGIRAELERLTTALRTRELDATNLIVIERLTADDNVMLLLSLEALARGVVQAERGLAPELEARGQAQARRIQWALQEDLLSASDTARIMATPLYSSEVESLADLPGAEWETTIETLQTVADQVGVATTEFQLDLVVTVRDLVDLVLLVDGSVVPATGTIIPGTEAPGDSG